MANAKTTLPEASPQELYDLARRIEQAGAFPDQEWTQGATARDRNGFTVFCASKRAVTFCAIGQLHRHAIDAYQSDEMANAVEEILPLNTRLAVWNDEPARSPEQVRRLFQEAAAKLYRKAVHAAAPTETPTAAAAPAIPARIEPAEAAAASAK